VLALWQIHSFMDKQQRIKRREEMMSLIEKWHQSGKPQKLFCQEQDLAYSAFY
jgi:hypothetical protein